MRRARARACVISKRTEGDVLPPAVPSLTRAPATATPAVLCCLLIIARRRYFMSGLIKCPCRASSPVTGLEWPRGFQEVKVPKLHDNGTGRW